jgi:hypothetical protein
VWGVESMDEGVGIVERIVAASLDWDFTAKEFHGLPENKREKYREAIRIATECSICRTCHTRC